MLAHEILDTSIKIMMTFNAKKYLKYKEMLPLRNNGIFKRSSKK